MQNTKLSYLLLFLVLQLPFVALLQAQPDELSIAVRNEHFNTKNNLAIKGYDPVSYFSGKPQKGDKQLAHTYKGITYYFSTAKNRDTFKEDPAKYEPAYGGWCAFAMADGGKTDVNPETFKIVDGKLLLFYDGFLGDTRKAWNKQAGLDGGDTKQITTANGNWKRFTSK